MHTPCSPVILGAWSSCLLAVQCNYFFIRELLMESDQEEEMGVFSFFQNLQHIMSTMNLEITLLIGVGVQACEPTRSLFKKHQRTWEIVRGHIFFSKFAKELYKKNLSTTIKNNNGNSINWQPYQNTKLSKICPITTKGKSINKHPNNNGNMINQT